MDPFYDAYEARARAGREQIDALQAGMDRRINRQAGNALAQGDFGGARNVFLQNGNIDQGLAVGNMGAQQQQQQQAQQEAALKARKEGLLRAAQAVQSVPGDQRDQVYRSTIRPTLQQLGMPEDLLVQMDAAPKDDASLSAFIAAVGGDRPAVKYFNTATGVIAIPEGQMSGTMAYEAPQDPMHGVPPGYRWNADHTAMEYIPGGPADPRVVGTRAAAGRAPPRPRAAGGQRPAGGGSASALSTAELLAIAGGQ